MRDVAFAARGSPDVPLLGPSVLFHQQRVAQMRQASTVASVPSSRALSGPMVVLKGLTCKREGAADTDVANRISVDTSRPAPDKSPCVSVDAENEQRDEQRVASSRLLASTAAAATRPLMLCD